MNLWRQLEAKGANSGAAGAATPAAPFIPRLDVALQVSAVVARVVLDARLWFAAAVATTLLVPGRGGDIATALLVALGSLLVWRGDRWRRIPKHLKWLAWADLNKPLMRRLSL